MGKSSFFSISGDTPVSATLYSELTAYIDDTVETIITGATGPEGPTGPAGAGDVVGPASATDGALALFDGTTGKLLKTSGVTTASFASASHTHTQSDVTSLVSDLALKAPLVSPTFTGTPVAPTASPGTNTTQIATTAFVTAAVAVGGGGGGGISDGDKGDITVSGTGTVWTIDPTTVTNAKLANMAANRLKGRPNSGTGGPEDLTASQVKAILAIATSDVTGLDAALSGKASTAHTHAQADVTNLVTDLAAKQPLDTDLTTIAGLTATTDNFIQSKASAWASRTVAQVKTDLGLTGTNSGDETASTILTKLLTVDGAGSGIDADLLGGNSSAAFALASHTHAAADIASGTIATARLGTGTANSSSYLRGDQTWATLAAGSGDVTGPASSVDNEIALFDSTTGKLIKRSTQTGIIKATSGVISAIAETGSIGDVLRGDGTFGGVTTGALAGNAVTNAKLADMATATIKGRVTAGTGSPEDLTVAQARTVLGVHAGRDYLNTAENGDLQLGHVFWTTQAGWAINNDPTNAYVGNFVAVNTSTTGATSSISSSQLKYCVPGDVIYFECYYKTDVSHVSTFNRVKITWYNKGGAVISSQNGTSNNTANTSYSKLSVTAAAPALATSYELIHQVVRTAGTLYVGGYSAYKKTAADFMVPENAQTVTSYTLVLTDAGTMVSLSNAAAITLTIPTNAVAAFPLNTRIDLLQYGAGQVTVGGAGVTLRSSGSKLKLAGQYSGATLWKKDTDEWVLIGDIVT